MASLRSGMPSAWTRLACAQCRRAFSGSPALASGHNRWSKVKHQKGAADAKKNQLRNTFSKTLTLYSRLYGADLSINSQLANAIASAKKAGIPKATIETAIARGQGNTATGGRLESSTLEVMMPPNVALMIDVETESRGRVVNELNPVIRRKGGTSTPTKFFFSRRGRVVFEQPTADSAVEGNEAATAAAATPVTADDILDDAIEAGAEDVEDDEEDGSIIVWTQPNQTAAIVNAIAAKFGLAVQSAENIWDANEDTQVAMSSSDDAAKIADIVAALKAYPDVRAVYANAAQGTLSEEDWEKLGQDLDW